MSPWVRQDHGRLLAVAGPGGLCLDTPVATHGFDHRTEAPGGLPPSRGHSCARHRRGHRARAHRGRPRAALPHRAHEGRPPGDEGAFILCSFWLADSLHLLGRTADARALYERLVALRNDVGLLSEEYDPSSGRLLGNLPQAFSHVALVNTAMYLGDEGGHVATRRARRR